MRVVGPPCCPLEGKVARSAERGVILPTGHLPSKTKFLSDERLVFRIEGVALTAEGGELFGNFSHLLVVGGAFREE